MADDNRSDAGIVPGISGADETDSRAGQVQVGQASRSESRTVATEINGNDTGRSESLRPAKLMELDDSKSGTRNESPTSSAVRFCVGGLLVGAVLGFPAHMMAGIQGLQGLALSIGLCVVPGVVTLYLLPLLRDKHIAFLVGSSLRLLFALGGAVVVKVVQPSFGLEEFYLWLMLCYMFALVFETRFILNRRSK